jgi:outer membrane protein assembly factor BamB
MRIIPSTIRWPLVLVAILLTASVLSGCTTGQIPAESWPGLLVDGETAYVAFTSAVYAVNTQSGQEIWRFPPTDVEQQTVELFYAPPALTAEGQLVVGGYNGRIFLLNASSGVQVGDDVVLGDGQGRIIGGPIVDGDYAYIPSTDGCLYTYELTSGDTTCLYEAEGPLWASPLIADGTVYLASLDHMIYALEQESGDLLWSQEISAAMAAAPVLVDDYLIVGTLGKGVIALDPADGSDQWEFETEGWVWGTPAIADDVVYFADAEGFAYAADVSSGEELWSFQPDGPIIASPLIDGDLLFLCTTEGVIVREAADNLPSWQQPLDGRQLTRPAVAGDILLVASIESDNLLTALIVESGAIRWPDTSTED